MSRLSQNQYRIYDWILNSLRLPVFAEVYKGAALSIKKRTSGYITFAAHAGRDLTNSIVRSYKGEEQGGRVQYKELVDAIHSNWDNAWGRPVQSASIPQADPTIANQNMDITRTISTDACISVQRLINEHLIGVDRSNGKDISFFKEFLRCSDPSNISMEIQPLTVDWQKARKWFTAHAHLRIADFSASTRKELKDHFSKIEKIFYKAATYTYTKYETLNQILQKTNN